MVLNQANFERVGQKYPQYNRVAYQGADESGVYFRLTLNERGEDLRGVIVVLSEDFKEVRRRPIVKAVSDGRIVTNVTLPI